MNKLKKLFSPTTFAATIATGMLLHATVALAAFYVPCLSQCATVGSQDQCYPGTGCNGGYGVYYCCPVGTLCCQTNLIQRGSQCPNGGGWCLCPD